MDNLISGIDFVNNFVSGKMKELKQPSKPWKFLLEI